jgi:hypothetical protein
MALSIGIPFAEHLERHPHGTLAALAPDPWITFGLELGDSSVVCHPRIKARSSGQANPVVLRHLSLKIRRVLPLLAPIAALQSDHENLDRHFGTSADHRRSRSSFGCSVDEHRNLSKRRAGYGDEDDRPCAQTRIGSRNNGGPCPTFGCTRTTMICEAVQWLLVP